VDVDDGLLASADEYTGIEDKNLCSTRRSLRS
jgi:hypothetical protein